MNGWVGKILRVHLGRGDYSFEDLDEKIAREYVGGRGLGAKFLYDEVDPKVDALSPENKLILSTGTLTATGAPTGCRFGVTTKSPLTGAITYSSAGGYLGPEIKFAGYDMIIIEGKAANPVYLTINDSDIKFKPAQHLWGKSTKDTTDLVRAEVGNKWNSRETHVACIGPAGENLVRVASIVMDKETVAARSGVGAVMGSKNLKAIAVRGTGEVTLSDATGFSEVMIATLNKLKADPGVKVFRRVGTWTGVPGMNVLGLCPTRNFQEGSFSGDKDFTAEVMESNFRCGIATCFACPIQCKRVTRVTTSDFEGAGMGPDHESLSKLGPNCGVKNVAAVIKANYLCNELGMDTISVGGTISCAMELYERGYLSEKEIGRSLRFGDANAMVEMVEKMGLRQDFGDVLAEGGYRLAEKYKHPEFFMGSKKQELPVYHCQGSQGMALEFATCNIGANHNKAGMVMVETVAAIPKLGKTAAEISAAMKNPPEDFRNIMLSIEGKAAVCITRQHEHAIIDSGGLCLFALLYDRIPQEICVKLMVAATGMDYSQAELDLSGEKIWNVEKLFNLGAGITARDDTLPSRLLKDPMLKGWAAGAISRIDEMLPDYYRIRGWDEDGVPTPAKLEQLGLRSKYSPDLTAEIKTASRGSANR